MTANENIMCTTTNLTKEVYLNKITMVSDSNGIHQLTIGSSNGMSYFYGFKPQTRTTETKFTFTNTEPLIGLWGYETSKPQGMGFITWSTARCGKFAVDKFQINWIWIVVFGVFICGNLLIFILALPAVAILALLALPIIAGILVFVGIIVLIVGVIFSLIFGTAVVLSFARGLLGKCFPFLRQNLGSEIGLTDHNV